MFATTKNVQFNPELDEYFIEFSDEEMETLGWGVGDNLIWTENDDGSFSIKKEENSLPAGLE